MIALDEVVICIALLLGYLVQTIAGFAAGLVSLPLMVSVLPIASAVGIISVFNFIFSGIQLHRNRRLIDLSIYRDLAPATIVGIFIGALLLSYGDPYLLKKLLGIFIIAYLVYRWKQPERITITPLRSIMLGLIGGFFAGLFSSGAPPFVLYMMNRFSEPEKFRANVIGILAIANFVRFFVLLFTGVINLSLTSYVLWGTPIFIISLLLGERIFQNLRGKTFMRLVLTFLALSAVLLLVK